MKTDDDVGHDNDDHDNHEEIRWKHHNGFHNEASTSQAIEFPIENLIFKILHCFVRPLHLSGNSSYANMQSWFLIELIFGEIGFMTEIPETLPHQYWVIAQNGAKWSISVIRPL